MRKVVYSVAMSLDGYVAGPNGEADWIVMDPEIDFMAMFSRFDTILMGRRTYEAAKSQGPGGSMPGIRSIVASTTLAKDADPEVTVVGDDLAKTISDLRREAGKDVWLFGGGILFQSMLKQGLVDVVEVAVIPVLLGGGKPLLAPPAGRSKLKLISQRVYSATGTVSLEYAVDR